MEEWVRYSARLPQYAARFRENSISARRPCARPAPAPPSQNAIALSFPRRRAATGRLSSSAFDARRRPRASAQGEDFFLMVSDGGRILKEDLGISSPLHRQQLARHLS